MRRIFGLCLLLQMLLPGPSSEASDLIRVLIFEDAKRLELSAAHGVSLTRADGDTPGVRSPLVLRPWAGGMLVNGKPLQTSLVTVGGRGGALTVTAEDAPTVGWEIGPRTFVVGGTVRVFSRDGGLVVVNEVELEEYVKGVVPLEMNAGWHPEALKVQAVVARTYALYKRMISGDREYDVVASIQDQAYAGRQGLDDRVERAVDSTRGVILTHRHAPILAAYSSTAAGPTEDAAHVWSKGLPYLRGVECPFDRNSPYYRWWASFRIQDLEENLARQDVAVGTIASVTPFAYSRAGRVTKLRILHSQGELILRGQDLRRIMGYGVIPSTQFQVEAFGREVILSGRGSGHAVGLCQWGAKELAELGYAHPTILAYYFPGTTLRDMRSAVLSSPPAP